MKRRKKRTREREREKYTTLVFCTFGRARRWAGGMNYLYALHQVGWRSIVAPSFLSFFFFFFFFFSVSSSTYIYELGYFFEILIFFPIQRRPVFDRGTALCVCVCAWVCIYDETMTTSLFGYAFQAVCHSSNSERGVQECLSWRRCTNFFLRLTCFCIPCRPLIDTTLCWRVSRSSTDI